MNAEDAMLTASVSDTRLNNSSFEDAADVKDVGEHVGDHVISAIVDAGTATAANEKVIVAASSP
eukprot:958475-Heterocapsa_arctica.AAC.1